MTRAPRVRIGGLVLVLVAGAVGSLSFAALAVAQTSSTGDVAAAEAGTIQRADVPSEYTESSAASSQAGAPPSSSSGSFAKEVKKIKECKPFVNAFAPKGALVSASADGATYENSTGQLSSAVLVFKSDAAAQKYFAPIKKSVLAKCLDKAMKSSVKKSLAQSSGTGVNFSSFKASVKQHEVPPVGDETVDYQIKFDITGKGSSTQTVTLTLYADMQFVLDGRAIASYMGMGMGEPLDSVQQPAVDAAVTRLTTALG